MHRHRGNPDLDGDYQQNAHYIDDGEEMKAISPRLPSQGPEQKDKDEQHVEVSWTMEVSLWRGEIPGQELVKAKRDGQPRDQNAEYNEPAPLLLGQQPVKYASLPIHPPLDLRHYLTSRFDVQPSLAHYLTFRLFLHRIFQLEG